MSNSAQAGCVFRVKLGWKALCSVRRPHFPILYHEKLQDKKLVMDHTLQEVLDELDVIECFEMPKKRLEVGKMTTRQREFYAKSGVAPPASLQ